MNEQYIGIPFVDGGRTLQGADCWGLVKLVYKDLFSIHLPEFAISAEDTHGVVEAMANGVSTGRWQELGPEEAPRIGDVVAMALCPRALRAVNHVAVYMGQGKFLHSIMGHRSALCRMDDAYWKGRIMGVYRWQG